MEFCPKKICKEAISALPRDKEDVSVHSTLGHSVNQFEYLSRCNRGRQEGSDTYFPKTKKTTLPASLHCICICICNPQAYVSHKCQCANYACICFSNSVASCRTYLILRKNKATLLLMQILRNYLDYTAPRRTPGGGDSVRVSIPRSLAYLLRTPFPG